MWHPLGFTPRCALSDTFPGTVAGSPIGDDTCVSTVLSEKVEALRRLGERLKLLFAHDALILLRNCFALPKLLYTLPTAPCFRSSYHMEISSLQKHPEYSQKTLKPLREFLTSDSQTNTSQSNIYYMGLVDQNADSDATITLITEKISDKLQTKH